MRPEGARHVPVWQRRVVSGCYRQWFNDLASCGRLSRADMHPARVLRSGTPDAGPNAHLNTTPQKWEAACRFGVCSCFELAHSGFGVE